MKENEKPSLFQFATKELSQDAFFCWLLSWADEKYKDTDLFRIAKVFLKEILGKEISVNDIYIKRQYKKIDFFVRLNGELTIVFEDKTGTEMHDNQLKRYKEIITEKYPNDKLFFVYIKNDLVFKEEIKEAEKFGYKVIDINKLFDILDNFQPKNDIYNDYYFYMRGKRDKYINFEKIEYSKLSQEGWSSFIYHYVKYYEYNKMWEKRESWCKIKKIDIGKSCLELQIKHGENANGNYGKLAIYLVFNNDNLKKKEDINNRLIKLFKDKKIKIKVNNRKKAKKWTEMISFIDFPKIDLGYFDCIINKKYIEKIVNIMNDFK